MNEISRITTNPTVSDIEISASHLLATEVYDHSNQKTPRLQSNVSKQYDAQNNVHPEAQLSQSMAKQSDEVQTQKYYRLGHTEDESLGHVVQTWRHVLNGNATKLEYLEFAIEAGAAIAALRFGVKKFWPMKTLPKSPVSSEIDDSILSQTLTGAQARTHPVMRAYIRTREAPTIVPR